MGKKAGKSKKSKGKYKNKNRDLYNIPEKPVRPVRMWCNENKSVIARDLNVKLTYDDSFIGDGFDDETDDSSWFQTITDKLRAKAYERKMGFA